MWKNKKIRELEQQLESLRNENYNLKKDENSETHKTGVHCIGCENMVEVEAYYPFGGERKVRYCKLDFDCKDRVENGL